METTTAASTTPQDSFSQSEKTSYERRISMNIQSKYRPLQTFVPNDNIALMFEIYMDKLEYMQRLTKYYASILSMCSSLFNSHSNNNRNSNINIRHNDNDYEETSHKTFDGYDDTLHSLIGDYHSCNITNAEHSRIVTNISTIQMYVTIFEHRLTQMNRDAAKYSKDKTKYDVRYKKAVFDFITTEFTELAAIAQNMIWIEIKCCEYNVENDYYPGAYIDMVLSTDTTSQKVNDTQLQQFDEKNPTYSVYLSRLIPYDVYIAYKGYTNPTMKTEIVKASLPLVTPVLPLIETLPFYEWYLFVERVVVPAQQRLNELKRECEYDGIMSEEMFIEAKCNLVTVSKESDRIRTRWMQHVYSTYFVTEEQVYQNFHIM